MKDHRYSEPEETYCFGYIPYSGAPMAAVYKNYETGEKFSNPIIGFLVSHNAEGIFIEGSALEMDSYGNVARAGGSEMDDESDRFFFAGIRYEINTMSKIVKEEEE